MDLGSVKLKEIWFKIKMVRCSVDPIEVWLGGQQRQLSGQVMCELGVLVGLADGQSLSYAKTKIAVSF